AGVALALHLAVQPGPELVDLGGRRRHERVELAGRVALLELLQRHGRPALERVAVQVGPLRREGDDLAVRVDGEVLVGEARELVGADDDERLGTAHGVTPPRRPWPLRSGVGTWAPRRRDLQRATYHPAPFRERTAGSVRSSSFRSRPSDQPRTYSM